MVRKNFEEFQKMISLFFYQAFEDVNQYSLSNQFHKVKNDTEKREVILKLKFFDVRKLAFFEVTIKLYIRAPNFI